MYIEVMLGLTWAMALESLSFELNLRILMQI